jgi:hypothetical protein
MSRPAATEKCEARCWPDSAYFVLQSEAVRLSCAPFRKGLTKPSALTAIEVAKALLEECQDQSDAKSGSKPNDHRKLRDKDGKL